MDTWILLALLISVAWHAYCKQGWLPYVASVMTSLVVFAIVMKSFGHGFSELQYFQYMPYMLPIAVAGSILVGVIFRTVRKSKKDN